MLLFLLLLEVVIDFIESEEQKDAMELTYNDHTSSGGGGMLSFDIGYSNALGYNISLVPKISAALYSIEFTNNIIPGASSKHRSTYVMPGIALRYNFSEFNRVMPVELP